MRGNRAVGTEGWVRGLGWFSIGLGLSELIAPKAVGRLAGVEGRRSLIRWMGLRETITGVGILSQRRPGPWLWGRVAGDAMDLAMLGAAMKDENAKRGRLAATAAAVAGVTVVDALCGVQLSRSESTMPRGIHVTKSIIIDRSATDLYQFWRQFENLPTFMTHLKQVQRKAANQWHWIARGPGNTQVQWDAEIITDKPNEVISWRSLEGSDVEHAGSVRFEPAAGDRGTLVKVELKYELPGGIVAAQLATFLGEAPEQQIGVELRRLKQLMETGEIATTAGQPAARPGSRSSKYDQMVQV